MTADQNSCIRGNEVICPESTIESANRRDFIRKAALVTAVAGVGATAIGQNFLPKTAAKDASVQDFCHPVFIQTACTCSCIVNALSVSLHNKNSKCCGFSSAVYAYSCACCGFVTPSSGPSGVIGVSALGNGVVGMSGKGYSLWGIASGPDAIPIVAEGACGQVNPLQKWVNHCGGKLSAMGPNATLALGTLSTQGFELRVCAPNQCGIQLRGPKTGVGAGLVFDTFCPASGIGQGWQILDTGCRASQGANKLNVRNLTLGKDVLTICGPNSTVGIETTAPKTTLQVNGSVSAKVANTGSKNYCMGASDFAVFACTASVTVTLPPADTAKGMIVFVKNTSGGSVTVAPYSGNNIEGSTISRTLSKPNDSLMLISNGGTKWVLMGNSVGDAFTS